MDNHGHLSLSTLIELCLLNPGFHTRVGNPDVTGIPQLTSMQAAVAYLTKTPITTKPVVRTH